MATARDAYIQNKMYFMRMRPPSASAARLPSMLVRPMMAGDVEATLGLSPHSLRAYRCR